MSEHVFASRLRVMVPSEEHVWLADAGTEVNQSTLAEGSGPTKGVENVDPETPYCRRSIEA